MGFFKNNKPKGALTPVDENTVQATLNEETLQQLTRKLTNAERPDYAESTVSTSTRGGARYSDLRYTKFTIGGIPGTKQAVFIRDTAKVTASTFEAICTAIGRERPSLLLRGEGSLCHPTRLCSPQLCSCPGFRPLVQEARSSLGLEEPPPGCCGPASSAGPEQKEQGFSPEECQGPVVDITGSLFERKLVEAAATLLDAAERARAWTVTGPRITGFELLLQQCLESGTLQANVSRLVLAHVQDKAYSASPAARSLLKQLFEGSVPTSSSGVPEPAPAVALPGDLWNPSKNTANQEFATNGFSQWSFDSYDDPKMKGHPLSQWPWPYGDVYIFFFREEVFAGAEAAIDVDWEYSTPKFLDQKAIPIAPDALAPVGHVFVGGAGAQGMKREVFQVMKTTRPLVLMDNTEGAVKQLAVLVRVLQRLWEPSPLVSCGPFLADNASYRLGGRPSSGKLLEAMVPIKILEHVDAHFDASAMPAAERLTLTDVVAIIDLVKRRLPLFKEAVCVVDPASKSLHGSVGRIISTLNSHHLNSSDLKAANIQRALVLKSWRMHRKLALKSSQLRRQNMAISVIIALAMFLGTLLAVVMVALRYEKLRHADVLYHLSATFGPWDIQVAFTLAEAIVSVRFLLVLFPVLAGLLSALRGQLQLPSQWAAVHMASAQVVSEIYHILLGVGPYATSPDMRHKTLIARLQRIKRHLVVSGLDEGELLQSSGSDLESFPEDLEALEKHVEEHVYGVSTSSLWRMLQAVLATCGCAYLPCSCVAVLLQHREPEDHAADVDTEAYVKMRVNRMRVQYKSWLRVLAMRRFMLSLVIFLSLGGLNMGLVISTSLGEDIVESGFSLMIPMAVGLAGLAATIMSAVAPQELVTVLGSALVALDSLDLWWRTSDVRDRHTPEAQRRLAFTVEGAARAVAGAYAQSTSVPDDPEDEAELRVAQLNAAISSSRRSLQVSRASSVAATPSDLMSELGSISVR